MLTNDTALFSSGMVYSTLMITNWTILGGRTIVITNWAGHFSVEFIPQNSPNRLPVRASVLNGTKIFFKNNKTPPLFFFYLNFFFFLRNFHKNSPKTPKDKNNKKQRKAPSPRTKKKKEIYKERWKRK